MWTGRRPFPRDKTKKIQFLNNRVKKSKNWKNPKNTYKNFFDLAPIPVEFHTKMILIPLLHSWTVEKTKKKSLGHPENGPFPRAFPIYSDQVLITYRALNKYQRRDFLPPRTQWWKIPHLSTKRGKCAPAGGLLPAIRPKKYNSWSSGSKIEKTSKFRKLLIKFFFYFLRSPSCLTPKWFPYPCYIAQPSRKQKKSCI